jgi:hypothetical protein
MPKPRLVGWLFLLQILAFMGLAAWWVSLPAAARLTHLGAVMVQEHVPTVVPDGIVDQVQWLIRHRRQRLTGLVGLLGMAGLVGLGEGIARRQTSPLGGFLLTWWTVGRGLLALLPGTVGGSLLAPWPLPGVLLASGLAFLVALVMYGLTAGRPYVP